MTWSAPKTWEGGAGHKLYSDDLNQYVRDNQLFLKENIALEEAVERVISSGAITKTKSFHYLTAETGTDDDLETINGGSEGDVLFLAAQAGHTISLKDTGNILVDEESVAALTGTNVAILIFRSTLWLVLFVPEWAEYETAIDAAIATHAAETATHGVTEIDGVDERNAAIAAQKLDDHAAPDDNTDNDVSTDAHGLCPKLDGNADNALRGDGSWGEVSSEVPPKDTSFPSEASEGDLFYRTDLDKLYVCDQTYDAAATIESNLAAQDDDAFVFTDDSSIDLSGTYIQVGLAAATRRYHAGMRFLGITIPDGAIITAAYLKLIAARTDPYSTTITIQGEQNNAAAAFSTYADFMGRSLTTESVSWVTGNVTLGTEYESEDIAAIIQELLDDYSGLSDDEIVIFLRGFGGINNTKRFASYDNVTYTEPILHIEYTAATSSYWKEIPREDNVLKLDNTDAFTPDADYEPATKKYADDAIDTDIATHATDAAAHHTPYTDSDAIAAIQAETDWLDKTHLSQDFGASSKRLINLIMEPVSDIALYINTGKYSGFDAKINSGGTGGLTATNVPYDNDSGEDMFNGLQVGATYWGRIVLYNTTRGNSRKIVSIDRTNNVIETESSSDDWADNDNITTDSPTVSSADYFDLDLSNGISSNVIAAFVYFTLRDNENAYDVNRFIIAHPSEAFDAGKALAIAANLAKERTDVIVPMVINSQKISMRYYTGIENCRTIVKIIATMEYADT